VTFVSGIEPTKTKFMSASSTDRGLLTPENCGVVFIDHQLQMLSVLAGPERESVIENVLVLAKAAKIFAVPVILSVIESKEFAGKLAPQLGDQFPGQMLLKRTSMNAWDDARFVAAIKQTGRRNFLLAALWSEACLVFPALQMLEEGYGIYVVKDASYGTNGAAHDLALRRVEQAGGVALTALQVLLEFQRDWAKPDHSEEVMAMIKPFCRIGSHEASLPAMKVGDVPFNPRPSPGQIKIKEGPAQHVHDAQGPGE
jgi:nicotinamidase-related amidase